MGKVSSKFLLLDSNGDPVTADIINDYFASTCKAHPPLQNTPANSAVSEIPVIEIHQTRLKLENLDTNKSVYPGDIPTKLSVKCAPYLSVPRTAIFNQCFVDGIFPVCFKRAIMSPTPKNKTPKVPSDLRPISKTSIFSKIFESFIYYFLFDDIQDKINPSQFGLRPNHSTTHCLCSILDTVFKHLELSISYVEAVFADISKAFDNLDHQTVTDNARALGVRDFVLCMVASFLSDRDQFVVLPNGDSSGFT
ncbi:uncharacterized protein LOC136029609 [Artemia franciscana]|uniref:uncharacterized protein LOC136029609 n=1 Tax=Artemia franciscana TaxID=6661 RepID=UPI0032DAF26F